VIEWRKMTTGKCRKLDDVPAGALIEAVNGRECVGMCEACLGPILDGQKHGSDSEGVMWHERCPRNANANADGRASRTVRRVVRLWCPDCDRETDHDVSGLPVAECCDCLEPHEMTADEICKANKGVTGAGGVP
jgi:hypothetical protein